MKTTVHKPYFWKQLELKYSLLDGFVHFTLSELVLSVQHSHCLKIQCSDLFFQLVVLLIPGSSPSPSFSPLKSGLVALWAETSQHGVQSVQVHFHRSLLLYFAIRRHHSLPKMERCILSTRIPTYGVKTTDNNFLRSGRDNNIRRGTLLVSGVYLNNFPLHNLLITGSFICC